MAELSDIAAGLTLLQGILQRDKGRGLQALPLEAATIARLRDLPAILRRAKAGGVASRASEHGDGSVVLKSGETQAAVVSAPPKRGEARGEARNEEGVRAGLRALFEEISSEASLLCNGTLFDTVVYSSGNPMADILFVGESPGEEEEIHRKPFVGPAGEKLIAILKAMGLRRQDVYLTNLLKRRAKINDGKFQQSRNRSPDPAEMEAYLPYLKREVNLVNPKVIVALGSTAAEGLLEKGASIASLRGCLHAFEGYPLVVTYHPSYLLRMEKGINEKKAKRAVWEDILSVMELLNMPISEKQRSYFQAN